MNPQIQSLAEKVISGLVPCNEIADGFLSNHPERSRAMIIESGNPVHSLAESDKFRAAMRAAELTVVIDVVHTETTEQADWILPASSQYEKVEATFFGANFPANTFHLRQAILEPLEGTLTEPEIHSRLVQASGVLDEVDFEPLREAAEQGLDTFAEAFMAAAMENPAISAYGAVVLYETLGKSLPAGKEGAAVFGLVAKWLLRKYPDQIRAAGHQGDGPKLGNALLQAIIDSDDGIIFTRHQYEDAFDFLTTPDQKVNLLIPEMHEQLNLLSSAPLKYTSEEYPFVLFSWGTERILCQHHC